MGRLEFAPGSVGMVMSQIAELIGGVLGPYHGGAFDVRVDEPDCDGVRASIGLRYSSLIHVSKLGYDGDVNLVELTELAAVNAARRAVKDLRGVVDALERGVDEYEEARGA